MIKIKKWFLKDWIEMFKAFAVVSLGYAFFFMWLVVTILAFERGLESVALKLFWFGSVGFFLTFIYGFLKLVESSRLKQLSKVKVEKSNLKKWVKK